jgi:hypothetical protein
VIPHLEGGIAILDQSLQSPFEVPSHPHVEDPNTSSEQDVQLDDVIEMDAMMNLDENETTYQSTEQSIPS